MGKKKQETKIEYSQPPSTPQIQQLSTMVTPNVGANIPYASAQARKDNQNTYRNPLGAFTSSMTQNAGNRSEASGMRESVLHNVANWQNQQQAAVNQGTVAGLTAPIQTGQTTTQEGGFWSSLLTGMVGNAAGAASAAM